MLARKTDVLSQHNTWISEGGSSRSPHDDAAPRSPMCANISFTSRYLPMHEIPVQRFQLHVTDGAKQWQIGGDGVDGEYCSLFSKEGHGCDASSPARPGVE